MENIKKISVMAASLVCSLQLFGRVVAPMPTGMELTTNVVAPRVSAVIPAPVPLVTPSRVPVQLKAARGTFERFVEALTAMESLRVSSSKLTQQIQTLQKQLRSADKQQQYLYALKMLFVIVRPLTKSSYLLSEFTDVINSAQMVEDYFSPETRVKFFQLASMAKTGYQYVDLMDKTLNTLLTGLKAREDKRKAQAKRAAELELQREGLLESSDVDFDSLFALADTTQEEHDLVVQKVQTTVEDIFEVDDSKMLQVLRVMDRLAKANAGIVRKNIADLRLEISARQAKPEAQVDPALKLFFVAAQPVADSCYIVNAIIELLATMPIFGTPFEKITSVTKQMAYHTEVLHTALKDLTDSLYEQEQ
ncbi:MAG TPA: hypothetical protein VGT41_03390 [Candidatus Babeliales bacterium]|nr:hypothetical protein [Candidatus Babeliales bacterium]